MPKPQLLEIAGREVTITNPGKMVFPRLGRTKLDLVNYYLAVADGALRGVSGRPGRGGQQRGGEQTPRRPPVAREGTVGRRMAHRQPAPVGRQQLTFHATDTESFVRDIAPARTFGFLREIEQLELSLNELEPGLERRKASERRSLESLQRAEQALTEWQRQWDEYSAKYNEAEQVRHVEQTRAEQLS